VPTNKNKKKLCVSAYFFHLEKTRGAKKDWSCEKRKSHHCRGRAQNFDGDKLVLVSHNKEHNHGPNPEAEELLLMRKKIKKLAKKTILKPTQIINEITEEVSTSLYYDMPTESAIKKIVHRKRKQNFGIFN
jgi:hypothetical protein